MHLDYGMSKCIITFTNLKKLKQYTFWKEGVICYSFRSTRSSHFWPTHPCVMCVCVFEEHAWCEPRQNISTHALAEKKGPPRGPEGEYAQTKATANIIHREGENETTGRRGLPITRPAAAVFSAWPLARHGPPAGRVHASLCRLRLSWPAGRPRKAHHVACHLSILLSSLHSSPCACTPRLQARRRLPPRRFGEPGQSRRASPPRCPQSRRKRRPGRVRALFGGRPAAHSRPLGHGHRGKGQTGWCVRTADVWWVHGRPIWLSRVAAPDRTKWKRGGYTHRIGLRSSRGMRRRVA
jgi:hypothetical protein